MNDETYRPNILGIVLVFMLLVFLTLCLCSCTYAVTLVHTEGQATDVVDETATNTPSTSVAVPLSIMPKPSL